MYLLRAVVVEHDAHNNFCDNVVILAEANARVTATADWTTDAASNATDAANVVAAGAATAIARLLVLLVLLMLLLLLLLLLL